jgi:pimeloyl-ACP methyl ester carboxylesterase
LAKLLIPHFTVFTYDRRGRGDSGDTPPYAVEREVEDIEGLIGAAHGSAMLYGVSSGAMLALEAANRLQGKVTKLAMYEPPFIVDDTRPPLPADYVEQLRGAVAANRRGDAVKLFMGEVGVPGFVVTIMSFLPMWSRMKAMAHTLEYDAALMAGTQSGRPLPRDRWSAVSVPTLVIDGGKSPASMRNGVKELADLLANARYVTLEGQTHIVKPAVLAPVLIDFLIT